MARYQLRRPSPITIVPRRIRRQAPAATSAVVAPGAEEEEGADEGPESPDSPFSSPSTVGADSPSPDTEAFPEAEGGEGGESQPSAGEEAPSVSGQETVAPTATDFPGTQVTGDPSPAVTDGPAPSMTTSVIPNGDFTSTVNEVPPAQSEVNGVGNGDTQLSAGQDGGGEGSGGGGGMSHTAEAALITFTILGGLALIAGMWFFIRRRRRQKADAERPFQIEKNTSNSPPPVTHDDLQPPPPIHAAAITGSRPDDPHATRSTDPNSLFGRASYQRPETVSTNDNSSRIQAPQPTPNPFADPPLNKSYDLLRGRPRSTTLTDRGSWERNPFQDPDSERFDPFGELEAKARKERQKYIDALMRDREAEDRERRERGAGGEA